MSSSYPFIDEMPTNKPQKSRRQLDQIIHFAEHDACRHIGLLGYFGETWEAENCGSCDVCLHPREKWDATLDVQKFLSCVARIRQAGRFDVGITHISEILTGGKSEKVMRLNHHQLTTYGIGRDQPRAYWVDIGRQLVRRSWLTPSESAFPTVSISPDGLKALKERSSIELTRPIVAPKSSTTSGKYDIPCDAGLFDALRALRKQLADARDIPAYVIFSDVTLRLLSREYPTDEAALLRISGVGQKKSEEYGNAFVQAIREWLQVHTREEFTPLAPRTSSGAKPDVLKEYPRQRKRP